MKTLVIYTNNGTDIINNEYDILVDSKNMINNLYYNCPKNYCYYLITNISVNIDIDTIIRVLKKYNPAILVLESGLKIYHRSVIHYVYPLLDIIKYGNDVYDIQSIVEEPLINYTYYMSPEYYPREINYRSKAYRLFEKCIIRRYSQRREYIVVEDSIEKVNFLNTFDIFNYFDIKHSYFKMKRIKFHKNNKEMYGECGMYHFRHDFHNINRNSIINHLIKKYNFKTYLEIGVYNCAHFNDVIIEKKYGVDPSPKLDDPIYQKWADNIYKYTSIEFFKVLDPEEKFDIIFIDGCLYEYNVFSDVTNSLEHLNENGIIVLHDCNPPNEFLQRDNYNARYQGSVPNNIIWNNRTYTDRNFNGKMWVVVATFMTTRPDLEVYTVSCDWGCGIIRRGKQELFKTDEDISNYQTLVKYRKYMLNLISPEKFLEIFD